MAKLEAGQPILQQTKGLDDADFTTYVIRTKEDEDDYRYFPEPDLPPFFISAEYIQQVKESMPPLPSEIRERLTSQYQLPAYDAAQLAEDMDLANYFFALAQQTNNYKAAANWLNGPVKNRLAENESLSLEQLPPAALAQLIQLLDEGVINYGTATQKLLPELFTNPGLSLSEYIQTHNLQMQSASDTDAHIEAALARHAQKITEYKKGKKGLLSLFVGEVMKLSKGKANAEEVTRRIQEKLNQQA
jgi:aspartyl-tRNA(Asn)/glutamyl-tRNA(Gln) amidotransferase subunit B